MAGNPIHRGGGNDVHRTLLAPGSSRIRHGPVYETLLRCLQMEMGVYGVTVHAFRTFPLAGSAGVLGIRRTGFIPSSPLPASAGLWASTVQARAPG